MLPVRGGGTEIKMELTDTPLMKLSDISKSYGRRRIISSLSLRIKKGSCVGILGANGCGKSTLLSILAGCLKPDSGIITKADHLLSGYVPQENPLFSTLTVQDNLRYFYADSPYSLKDELAGGIPHLFGLDACLKTRVKHLSGGMKRRLSIACALSQHPAVLILDEPGASLDFVCKQDILQYLRSYLKEGGTVILASHEQEEIALCDDLFLMENGALSPLSIPASKDLLTERMRRHE